MKKASLTRFMLPGTLIVIIGAIFRIQHWPGGRILMLTGLLLGLILLVLYYKSNKAD
jgi:hypothetical protein